MIKNSKSEKYKNKKRIKKNKNEFHNKIAVQVNG